MLSHKYISGFLWTLKVIDFRLISMGENQQLSRAAFIYWCWTFPSLLSTPELSNSHYFSHLDTSNSFVLLNLCDLKKSRPVYSSKELLQHFGLWLEHAGSLLCFFTPLVF